MHRQFQFQLPFDSTAYQRARAKGKGAKNSGSGDKKTASGTKPIHSKGGTSKSTTRASGNVTMNVSEEFPPTQTLLLTDVHDLTGEDGAVVRQPKSACQQATQDTQKQVTQGRPTQGQPTQGQLTQGQATRATQGQATQATHGQAAQERVQVTQGQTAQERAQATLEIEDGNIQGSVLYPLDLADLLIPSRQRHS
jgi:hypothetical protein